MRKFDAATVKAKIDYLESKGLESEREQVLLEPWPGMEVDIDCLYQHLFLEAQHGATHLFLKSFEDNGDSLRFELPDWTMKTIEDFIGRYGELEGGVRYLKAAAFYAVRLCGADGWQNLQSDMEKAVGRMSFQ